MKIYIEHELATDISLSEYFSIVNDFVSLLTNFSVNCSLIKNTNSYRFVIPPQIVNCETSEMKNFLFTVFDLFFKYSMRYLTFCGNDAHSELLISKNML
jgi:hypothetical protein